jgi:hypothetical protein
MTAVLEIDVLTGIILPLWRWFRCAPVAMFLLAQWMVLTSATFITFQLLPTWPARRPESVFELFVSMAAMPMLTVILITELTIALHCPVVLESRAGKGGQSFVRGLAAGIIGVASLLLLLPLLDEVLPQWTIASGACSLAAAAMLVTTRRVRIGECVRCGYDLSATPVLAPCSECGLARI